MKKILAVLLALTMALGCALGVAEEAAQPEIPAFTAVNTLYVDEEVLMNVLSNFGMAESLGGIIQTALPIISGLSLRAACDGEAAQLDVLLNDASVASVTGRFGENGVEVVSTLIPSYAVLISPDTLNSILEKLSDNSLEKIDLEAVTNELIAIALKFQDKLQAAYTLGEPEQVEFPYGDLVFNTMVPIDIDMKALSVALLEMEKELLSNEAIKGLLSSINPSGMPNLSQIEESIAEIQTKPEEELPEIISALYSITDEEGKETVNAALACFDVDTKAEETGVIMLDMLYYEEAISFVVQAEQKQIYLAVTFDPATPDHLICVKAKVNGMLIAADLGVALTDESFAAELALYLIDAEKPLLVDTLAIAKGAEAIAPVDLEGKTVVTVESLMQDESGEAKNMLMADLTQNGLMGLLGAAAQAMPEEIGALMNMFMGGTPTTEVPTEEIVEEAPAEEGAPAA